MKNQHLQSTIASAAIALGLGFTALPTLSQVTNNANPGQFENNAEKDPYFGGNNGSDFSIFNLMRNAQLGTQRTSGELIEEQREDWNKNADDFRRQQLERLNQPAKTAPNVTPPSSN